MSVIISKAALKDIAELDSKMRNRILIALTKLQKGEIKPEKLKGLNDKYKFRAGKYRVIFKYNKDGNIEIAKVKLRKIVYRKL